MTSFLDCLSHALREDERLILCAFRGDPNEAVQNAWRPRPWRPGVEIPFTSRNNAYVTVASFGRAADGSFRRRKDVFKAGHALMVDDVISKIDPAIVRHVPPTAIVETSPNTQQWWYALEEPERDADHFDSVIRAFIRNKLLGNDPGMSGITRVGRLPGFTNGKPQHNGFITQLLELEPERRFTIDELVSKFKLELLGRRMPPPSIDRDAAKKRIDMFYNAQAFLQRRKMFKRRQPDPSGWREMHCPWKDEHTNSADTGAAIREPHAENQHYGAFRCHHGHCLARGWNELTEWIADLAAEGLA